MTITPSLPDIQVSSDILLKELAAADAQVIFGTIDAQRSYLGEWLPFVPLTTDVSFTEAFVNTYVGSPRNNPTFTIWYKGAFAGLIGFKDSDYDNEKTEIGYWLSEAFQHKGIVTLACQKLIEFAFDELQMNRIQIKVAEANTKSRSIPERLGFCLEGIERCGEKHANGYFDLCVYSLLKSEY
jgi:ribosomal-protein-serine acetyltransferase